MKRLIHLVGVAVVFLIVFWPWLLHGVNLVWVALFDEWAFKEFQRAWSAVWSGVGYQMWPAISALTLTGLVAVWKVLGPFTKDD